MPDFYGNITAVDPAVQERLADIMEIRAADARQKAMLANYLAHVPFPEHSRVLEVGCGTGSVTRVLAGHARVSEAIGIDPSPIFVAKAQELGKGIPGLSFQKGDGHTMAFDNASFDAVIFHTTLCHVSEAERALAEAYRVLRVNGHLVVFDGDYATIDLRYQRLMRFKASRSIEGA